MWLSRWVGGRASRVLSQVCLCARGGWRCSVAALPLPLACQPLVRLCRARTLFSRGLRSTPTPPPTHAHVQVMHLAPSVRSSQFWREVQLLRRCAHPRIVPVYGVAVQVSWRRCGDRARARACGVCTPSASCLVRPAWLPGLAASIHPQGQLLMVAMRLMLGGSLRMALRDPDRRAQLRWEAKCGRAPACALVHGKHVWEFVKLVFQSSDLTAGGPCIRPMLLYGPQGAPGGAGRSGGAGLPARRGARAAQRHQGAPGLGGGSGPGWRWAGPRLRCAVHGTRMQPPSPIRHPLLTARPCAAPPPALVTPQSANVLLTRDWRARLSDLGVAQALGAASARTAAGGSRLYASPEQLLGKRCTLAADVYSLGLLLVELATRRLISRRASWALPQAPGDCPQVRGRGAAAG